MRKHVRELVSLALAAAMLLSLTTAAFADEAETAAEETGTTDVIAEDEKEIPPGVWSDAEPELTGQVPEASNAPVAAPRRAAARAAVCPTYDEAYKIMTDLQSEYPEGTTWTNFEPYGSKGSELYYTFKGGAVKGARLGVGCAAFAFILSDAVFGDLPAETIDTVQFDAVRPGDILRVNNNSHFVIVLQKGAGGVVVAEGNYNKTVHWGRVMSKAEVENATFLVTRYPSGHIDESEGNANEVVKEGKVEGLTWIVTKGGTLAISGDGAIPNYHSTARPEWENYGFNTIVIEDGVTSIGDSAFYKSGALSVYIPSSVTSIGESAFRESSITAVTISGRDTEIKDNAFRNCESLTSATISEGVRTIGENAFRGCTALRYIDFPASITSIGAGAFMDCTDVKQVRFSPGTVSVEIGDDLFRRCQNLTDVMLPERAERISNGMFANCNSLSELYIPAGVSSIMSTGAGSISGPFQQCPKLTTINYGGAKSEWISRGGQQAKTNMNNGGENVTVNFNVPFNNPFAKDPNDPGDGFGTSSSGSPSGSDNPQHTQENCPNKANLTPNQTCSICGAVGTKIESTPTDDHNWSTTWSSDGKYHWHKCTDNGCTEIKDYAPHDFDDNWVIDTPATSYQNGSRHRDCTVCGYRQTESIPAAGGSSSSSGSGGSSSSSSGGGSSSGGSTTTSTTKNEDGSTTVRRENKTTGTVTETTRNTDGSQTVVETKKDGTVTTTETDAAGNRTATVANPDGSSVTTVARKDGTTATVTTDAEGRTEAEVRLSVGAVAAAQENNGSAALPIPAVTAAKDIETAPVVTVDTGSKDPVRVEIPAVEPTPGTVAVLVNADGSTEVVKTSVPTANGISAALPNGAVVKVVDNSKSFSDVPAGFWSQDAIAFTSARELFAGTTETTFSPDRPMTRAMLMTVLARLDGEDTANGAAWYTKGVEWAVENGISDGTNLNGSITREQLVTMLWRYLGSPANKDALSRYTDAGQISGYAQEAMRWAVENGVISGFGEGLLGPQEQATRAQVAQILMNFIVNTSFAPE